MRESASTPTFVVALLFSAAFLFFPPSATGADRTTEVAMNASAHPAQQVNALRVCPIGCDYDNVKDAVRNASPGSEIKLASGVYVNPDIGVEGRFVTVNKSLTFSGGYAVGQWDTPDPTVNRTIFDGQDLGQILYADTTGITVTVSGITFQRAKDYALNIQNARLLLTNSTVISTTSGYGVYLYNSDGSQLTNNTIAGTTTSYGIGIAIEYDSDDVTLSGNTIANNYYYGVYVSYNNDRLRFLDNTITNNRYSGVYFGSSSNNNLLLNHNTVANNGDYGVYLYSSSNSALLTANTVANNTDGGIYVSSGSNLQLDNNLIVRNGGVGLDWNSGSGTLRHNTFADNRGEAAIRTSSASLVLSNTIVSGHTYGIRTTSTSANVHTSHTLWFSNTTNTAANGGIISTTVDLYANPGFVGGTDPYEAYHLGSSSPAIDVGIDAGLYTDINGNPRPYDHGYDVGADEYPGAAITPAGITITGPITATVQHTYGFAAELRPITTTPPITYVWTTAGMSPIVHVTGREDTAAFVWHEPGAQMITVTATNEAGTITGTHTIMLESPAAAAFPFSDTFESGTLAPVWFANTTPQGRVRVTNYTPYAGAYALLLDDAVSDEEYSTAEAILTIDLAEQPNAILDFWWREFDDENHPEDGVYLSDNYGSRWVKALSFNDGPNSYRHEYIDLGAIAATKGLLLNDHFQVKFQYYDNHPIPNDGYAIDNVAVGPVQPFSGVSISGPSGAATEACVMLTAAITPTSGTPPITYIWQATGQPPVTQTAGITTAVTYTWTSSGVRTITITAANSLSSASAVYTLTVGAPPTIPSNPTPQDGATGVRVDTQLAWQASDTATAYDLYLWQNGQGQPTTPTASGLLQPTYDPPGSLPKNTTFRWYVRVRNTFGAVNGPTWTFRSEQGLADLVVSKSAVALGNQGIAGDGALAGSRITYTLGVANSGQSLAAGVILTDSLPASLMFETQSAPNGFVQNGNMLTWQVGDLASGQALQIQVIARIFTTATGTIQNQVNAGTGSVEETTANNTASVSTQIEAALAILAAGPSAPILTVRQGSSASTIIAVRNIGQGTMTGIQVTPPSYIPWVSVDTGGITQLAPGASAVVTLTAGAADNQVAGYYRDYVTVSSSAGQRVLALSVQVTTPVGALQLTVQNDRGEPVTGASVHVVAHGTSVIVTQGVTQTFRSNGQAMTGSNGVALLPDLPVGAYDFVVTAKDYLDASGVVVVSEGTGSQEQTLTMTGVARLELTPAAPVVGIVPGRTGAVNVQILNAGAAALTGVTITPPARLPWVYLGAPSAVDPIAPGQSIDFTIFASPVASQSLGIYQDYVQVTADGGQTRQLALTVEVSDSQTRTLDLIVTDSDGVALTNGTATLVQQASTVQMVEGRETTFNRQYTAPLDGSGRARFAALAAGDYNYAIAVEGYENNRGSLSMVTGSGVQATQVIMKPSPFTYNWTVMPINQEYDITLTLTR